MNSIRLFEKSDIDSMSFDKVMSLFEGKKLCVRFKDSSHKVGVAKIIRFENNLPYGNGTQKKIICNLTIDGQICDKDKISAIEIL